MCGRYSLIGIDDLGNRFRVFNPMIGARSRFNIAPGSRMPVIVHTGRPELAMMTWGLVPARAADTASAPRLINARAETIGDKPSFRELMGHHRCLVPASGFFEWKKEGGKKIPFYVHLPDAPLFAFAGLYDEWRDPAGGTLVTYTIITCKANGLLATVHNRMPVILPRDTEDRWLSETPLQPGEYGEFLVPYPPGEMAMDRVSPLVNATGVDDERVIRPPGSSGGTQTLLAE